MAEPTDEQLRDYIDKMPQIYKDVLAAFPDIAPTRRRGEAILCESISGYVAEQDNDYRLADIDSAIEELIKKGVLRRSIDDPSRREFHQEYKKMFPDEVFPLPIGERIIKLLTGKDVYHFELPRLPEFTWS
jgi:hypothetical protein